tara:strand:+ start:701 stop:1222 length:522 start_codon:yes stop_codon:yes gene_type:complete
MADDNENNKINELPLDDVTQNHLSNLKILARVKINNKLYYRDNKFHIDSAKSTQGVSRWWSKESRVKTVSDLDHFVTTLFQNIDDIYNKEANDSTYYNSVSSNTPSVFKQENSNLLIQFSTEINNAISGLANLKITYKSDITTLSNLEIIIEKLSVRMKKIQALLKVADKKNA